MEDVGQCNLLARRWATYGACQQMKTVLICHEEEPMNRIGMTRWLASFTDLAGVIVLEESGRQLRARFRRELRRVGWLRFLDVVAFRFYYRLRLAEADRRLQRSRLEQIFRCYPEVSKDTRVIHAQIANSLESQQFLQELAPDLVIARCKQLLAERIFSNPRRGTIVMHPGVCPEYRNAHGCFWALAERDLDHVGMTLLKINKGIDAGPIYGYFTYPFDEARESHITIQDRVVFDNLPEIAALLGRIADSTAVPLDVEGRASAVWGQPQLTRYLAWKRAARRTAA
jgi:folate-dependent phosphoribosylglycinamide formyltransferase PurN